MNKITLFNEINKELKKLNDRIDAKIIRGRSYEREAQRHKDLLSTLERISRESEAGSVTTKRRSLFGKSPVRRRLKQGVVSRMFNYHFA
jgi:hypothetical protein